MNCSGGRFAETRRRFQIASPASHMPGLRPIRGSGLGAADVEALGALVVVTGACAQAPSTASATAANAPRTNAARGDCCDGDMNDVIRAMGEMMCGERT